MPTLEQEFEEYKALHKFAILKAKILQYFKDIEADKVLVPDFQRKGQTPEDLTEKELQRLVLLDDNLQTFNRLYEQAYKELAEVLS